MHKQPRIVNNFKCPSTGKQINYGKTNQWNKNNTRNMAESQKHYVK